MHLAEKLLFGVFLILPTKIEQKPMPIFWQHIRQVEKKKHPSTASLSNKQKIWILSKRLLAVFKRYCRLELKSFYFMVQTGNMYFVFLFPEKDTKIQMNIWKHAEPQKLISSYKNNPLCFPVRLQEDPSPFKVSQGHAFAEVTAINRSSEVRKVTMAHWVRRSEREMRNRPSDMPEIHHQSRWFFKKWGEFHFQSLQPKPAKGCQFHSLMWHLLMRQAGTLQAQTPKRQKTSNQSVRIGFQIHTLWLPFWKCSGNPAESEVFSALFQVSLNIFFLVPLPGKQSSNLGTTF